MFKYYTSQVFLLAGISHLLCCGIPFLLSTNVLFANLVFSKVLFSDNYFLETAENILFMFSTVIIMVLVSMKIYEKKKKCSIDGNYCTKIESKVKNKKIKISLSIALILYVFNTSTFLLEKIS